MLYFISFAVDRSWDICLAFSNIQLLFSTSLLGVFFVHSKVSQGFEENLYADLGTLTLWFFSSQDFPLQFTAHPLAPNSVLWHLDLIKQQISPWIITALCHINWEKPSRKSQINVNLTQCHLILSRVGSI